MRRLTLAAPIVLLLLSIGCASDRSNTRALKDTTAVYYLDIPTGAAVQDQGLDAVALGAAELALELGIKAAKALIKMEAEKYTETYAARGHFVVKGLKADPGDHLRPQVMSDAGLILLVRTVHDEDAPKADEETPTSPVRERPLFDADVRQRLAESIAKSLLQRGIKANANGIAAVLGKAAKLNAKGKDVSTLGLCAAFVLVPRPGGKSLELQLLGSDYPLLKAKNLSCSLPFVDWEKTKTLCTLVLQGPHSDSHYVSGHYGSTVSFELKWPRDPKDYQGWVGLDAPHEQLAMKSRSVPLAVPHYSNEFNLTATVLESSDLKEKLEELAEKVGEIEVDLDD